MIIYLTLYAALIGILTAAEYRGNSGAQWLLKPLAALGFILIALQSGALETAYGQFILGALCLCTVGDVALLKRGAEKIFIIGMGAFGLGHALFAATFFGPYESPLGTALGLALAAILIALFLIFIWKHVTNDMRLAVGVYIGIIGIMLVTAMGYAVSAHVWTVGLGAAMFAISDFFVGRDRFVTQKPWHALVITPFYFGAQALFALSVAQVL